jgi:hypothetical protein
MIFISRSLLLQPTASVNLSAPVILWNSLVTADTLTVSSEAEDYPAANLATDSTLEYWRAADASPVAIEVEVAGQQIDALGIARHNLGSSHATVTVEALVSVDGGPDEWIALNDPQMPGNNAPILFRFVPLFAQRVRITIEGGTAPAQAAVLYVGKLLIMPHGISAGHVPLDQAHTTQVVNGRSERGNFLGRIITGQSAQTSAAFETLPIDWYYAEMEPFIDRGMAGPFFFAWLPQSRPDDIGFAWLNTDPRPNMGSLYFDVTLDYGGITW